MGIHQERTHPTYQEGCDPCRWGTVDLFQVGLPQAAADQILAAKRDEFEIDAYRKLRDQGIRPETTRYPELLEARNKSRLRSEPYDAGADDGSKDWGTRSSVWTERDGIGDVETRPIEVRA